MEGKVFVALGNGDLVVYCRDIGKFLLYVGIKSVISVIKKESFPGRSRVRILVRAFICMLVSFGYFLCIYVFICVCILLVSAFQTVLGPSVRRFQLEQAVLLSAACFSRVASSGAPRTPQSRS